MTFEELRNAWASTGEPLVPFPKRWSEGASVPNSASDFLQQIGLPADAAPFLSFGPHYREFFASWDLPADVLAIGSNGSGDPVVVTSTGLVAYLNHDAGFRRVHVSPNVQTLAETLLRFHHLIDETLERQGPDAYLDGQVPSDLQSGFVEFLRTVDPQSMKESMWAEEVSAWASSPSS